MAKKTAKKKTTRAKPAKKAKSTAKKATAKKKTTAKKTTKKAPKKTQPTGLTIESLSAGAQRIMLANLGLYGEVFDELQTQLKRARATVQEARKNPEKANRQLVARGEKLLDQVKDLLKKSGAPATKQFEKQVKDFREALTKLRRRLER